MSAGRNTIIWAIVACLLWSTAYAGIKLGLQYDTPLHFAGIRFIISGLMILPFTVKPSEYIVMVKEHRKVIALVLILQTLINYSLFYIGLDLVPGSLGAVIVGSQPLVTAVVAAMMHEEDKLTGHKIITIVFGISGVILISAGRQAFRLGTAAEFLGVILILAANIATATSNVVVSLKSNGLNPYVLSSATLGAGGIILYLVSFAIERPVGLPKPPVYWIDLVWLSFMSAYAFSIWYMLLQRPGVKVSELNLWKFLIPAVGAILSWLLVPGENPEPLTIIGMVVITSSLIMFFITSKEKAKPQ
ncbi:MAG TPA: DMT family transporter [Bacteroidales bacterium]|nr:DMT family transporter [Bacteroidales bacterium]